MKNLFESPIEKMMARALWWEATVAGFTITLRHDEKVIARVVSAIDEARHLKLWIQRPIAEYRVDFFAEVGSAQRVVIECDGHDFHERTAAQAERDRRRDRVMTTLGLAVFRFTGREINRDAFACAQDVLRFFISPGHFEFAKSKRKGSLQTMDDADSRESREARERREAIKSRRARSSSAR